MGRHELPRARRKRSVLVAAVVAPAAVFFAVAGDVGPPTARDDARPVAGDVAQCCVEIVAAPVVDVSGSAAGMGSARGELFRASRLRVDSRFLPVGVANERRLQVRTILTARNISATFPQIHEIGGWRPDALRWHPEGLALDVMIPDPESSDGIALGNQIVAYVLSNATRFGIQDAIWRGVYYTPDGAQSGGGYGHYDHVHVTTTGGGYPSGGEMYLR